ncbi:Histidine kinase-like ATPase domain-containing protein [Actinomadura mexicana]|uniref:Histidine kinase-like ATPase domain-containing protein n=1 Tax=Actinomadura mexicana TaxID=134959 RepID=A0A239ARI3_9ACTN|nr:Histidine kinase-like ATPase domain-containing protein [Actinomadura mexicana]
MTAKFVIPGELDMSFLAARTGPGQVRMQVELRLASWGLRGLADDVTLIASELVTNAVRHASEREIRVRLVREPRGVLLEVWDSSDDMPVRRQAADDAAPDAAALEAESSGTRGRGLPIVEALAFQCGVRRTEPRGKWVWARVVG